MHAFKHRANLKTRSACQCLAILCCLHISAVFADYGLDKAQTASVDTSKWQCKFCPDEHGNSGYVEGFIGHSDSDSSARFKRTEAKGDEGQTAFSADVVQENESNRIRLQAANVGNDSSDARIRYNNHEGMQASLGYTRSKRYQSEGGKTLYPDHKNTELALPPSWATQTNTGAMDLDALYGVSAYQRRENLETEVNNQFGDNAWGLAIRYRQQSRSGAHWTSGSILNDVTALPHDRDDRTRELTITASVPFGAASSTGAAGLEYFQSEYENDHRSLSWENPFTPSIAGANQGQLALSPDNDYKRWRLFGHYQKQDHLFNASFSEGRGEQDDAYLPYTTNTTLVTQALPRPNYDGEIETRHARLGWRYRINQQWQLKSRYSRNERENVSGTSEYEPVLTDSIVQGSIENPRYSHKKSQLELNLDWHWRPRSRFEYHYEFEDFQRSHESTGKYKSHQLAFSWKERWHDKFKTSAKVVAEEREQKDPGTSVADGDNPFYSDFTVADRLRNGIDLNMNWQHSPAVLVTANAAFQEDDYQDSVVGVKETQEESLGMQINWQVNTDLSLNASIQRSWMYWFMAGSAQQTIPTWDSEQKDQYDVFTLGVNRSGLNNDTLTVGANFSFVANRGETDVSTPGQYADIHSDNYSLQTYLDYDWRPNWQVRFETLYERYQSVNPGLIAVNTLPKVIGNSVEDENYSEWLFGIRLRYRIPN